MELTMDDEKDREEAAADALRRGLDGETIEGEDRDLLLLARRIQASAGLAPPLDTGVRDEAIDRALERMSSRSATSAATEPRDARRRRWVVWAGEALAAACAVAVMGSAVVFYLTRVVDASSAGLVALPETAYSSPTDALFDGPFPDDQTPAERVDRILEARTRGYFEALAARRGAGGPAASASGPITRAPAAGETVAMKGGGEQR
jgi:hypothetical protein